MMNDLNILELSPLFNNVFARRYPPFNVSFKIGEQQFDSVYFLADGIYPCWRDFEKSYSIPANLRQEYHNTQQEGVRKCVERLVVVLFQQFQILQRPSKLRGLEEMQKGFKARVVMHNMVVDIRRDAFVSCHRPFPLQNNSLVISERLNVVVTLLAATLGIEEAKSIKEHKRIRDALVDYQWDANGKGV
jgi:Plant transposon protein